MGATVSLSRRASAFRTAKGTFYALFETTYDKDVQPHDPETHCVAFGRFEQVMLWIFSAMAACENGFVQGVRGAIDPIDYLQFWQHALRRPDQLYTQPIWLKAAASFRASVPTLTTSWHEPSKLPFALKVMQDHGYPTLAERIGAGEEVVMDLHRDAELLAALYGGEAGKRIAPWRIIDAHGTGEGDPSLAPPPRPTFSGQVPGIQVYGLDDGLHYCAILEGGRSLFGTVGDLLHTFISDVAAKVELKAAGAGVAAIQAFRRALCGPVGAAPDDLRIRIDKAALLQMVYFRERYTEIERWLGDDATPVDWGLVVSMATLRRTDSLLQVLKLPGMCLSVEAAGVKRADDLFHTEEITTH